MAYIADEIKAQRFDFVDYKVSADQRISSVTCLVYQFRCVMHDIFCF